MKRIEFNQRQTSDSHFSSTVLCLFSLPNKQIQRRLVGQLRRSKSLRCLLQTLEVLYGLNTQFKSSIIITHNHRILVHLKGRYSPHMIHTLFHTLSKSKCLMRAIDDNHNLTSVQNRAYTHCQSSLRNLIDIIIEETAICQNSIIGL